MNRRTHMVVGGGAGLVTYLLMKQAFNEEPTLKGALLWATVGALAAAVPDGLEPAVSSHHRGTFHSVTITVSLSYLLYRAIKYGNIEKDLKLLFGVLGSGYGSHLVLDSFTPRGLPLI